MGPGYKIIVRPPLIIWGVLIKTWHFQGYLSLPGQRGQNWHGYSVRLLVFYLILSPAAVVCVPSVTGNKTKNIGMKECSRLWEIPGILLRHINTHLRILSIVKKPNRGLEPINLELMNLSLSLSPPTGYHLGTTCSWPIASRCRFAIEFLQTFLSLKLVSQPAQVYSAPEFINIGILAVWETLNVSTVAL